MSKRIISIVGAAALHAGVVAAALISWPSTLPSPDDTPEIVPVDIVTTADVTNVAPTVEEKKPDTPPPEEKPAPEAEAPPAPQPEAEPAPPPPDERLTPPKEAEKIPAPENPAVPRLKPKPDAPAKFDVDSVLALLDKRAPPKAPQADAKVADTAQKGIGAQNAFTADLKDTLLSQMRQCWNVPVGAPNPEQLIVQVRVFLKPDGSVAQTQVEPATVRAEASNRYMVTAAQYAVRAIKICSPYKHLPPERYDDWREIVMTFDPSKMIGK